MKNNLFTEFELLFWDFAIKTLSYFKVARASFAVSAQMGHDSDVTLLGILLAMAGVTGLVSGYLFYFFTASLR